MSRSQMGQILIVLLLATALPSQANFTCFNGQREAEFRVSTRHMTITAKDAALRANRIAGQKGSSAITPEHLMLALIEMPGGFAQKILTDLNINAGEFKDQLVNALTFNVSIENAPTDIPLGARTQQVLVEAGKIMNAENGSAYIDAGTLMLAILKVGGGPAADFLKTKLGSSGLMSRITGPSQTKAYEVLKTQIARMRSPTPLVITEDAESGYSGVTYRPKLSTEDMSISLTGKAISEVVATSIKRNMSLEAKNGMLNDMIGDQRSQTLQELITYLSKSISRHVLLLGDTGIGKTKLVEALALAQARQDARLPQDIKDADIVVIDAVTMMDNLKGREILDALTKDKGHRYVVVIDNISELVKKEVTGQQNRMIGELSKALQARNIWVIGTDLPSDGSLVKESKSLGPAFNQIIMQDLSLAQTRELMSSKLPEFTQHHGVSFENLDGAETNSFKKIARQLWLVQSIGAKPAAAMAIMDNSMAIASVRLKATKGAQIMQVQSLLNQAKGLEIAQTQLEVELNAARSAQNASRVAQVEQELVEKQSQINSLREQANQIILASNLYVSETDVKTAITNLTGVPADIEAQARQRFQTLEEEMRKKYFGHQNIFSRVLNIVKGSFFNYRENGAGAVIMAAGISSNGKSFLAESLAVALFGSKEFLITESMTDYSEAHTVSKVLGSPKGYVGNDDMPDVMAKIRAKPISILLLDEFDMAHADVQTAFRQAFHTGYLEARNGMRVSLRNVIVIVTTNKGQEMIIGAAEKGIDINSDAFRTDFELYLKGPRGFNDEALINRLVVVPMGYLDAQALRSIAAVHLVQMQSHLRGVYEGNLLWTPEVLDYLTEMAQQPANFRQQARFFDNYFREMRGRMVDEISKWESKGKAKGQKLTVTLTMRGENDTRRLILSRRP